MIRVWNREAAYKNYFIDMVFMLEDYIKRSPGGVVTATGASSASQSNIILTSNDKSDEILKFNGDVKKVTYLSI